VARLGQRFFFDPAFSGPLVDGDNDGESTTLGHLGETGRVACAGCHVASAGFLDDRTLGQQLSLGAGWTHRRTPSLLDVGQARLVMWDGRIDTLYGQIFGPLEAANEMNSSRLYAATQVWTLYRAPYEAVFGALPPLDDARRFPRLAAAQTGCRQIAAPDRFECHGMPGDGAEYDHMAPGDQDAVTRVVVNVGKAIGAYERLLACGAGRFDAWVHGRADALTRAEQRGAALFVGRAGCVACHAGPFLSDQGFHNVGLRPVLVSTVFLDANDHGAAGDPAGPSPSGIPRAIADPLNVRGRFSDGDDGRLPAVVSPAMEGAFRTPALRCVGMRPSFMHTGQLRSLEAVVEFFDRGGDPVGYPGANELHPLGLSVRERADLVAFLRALDGPGPAAALRAAP
jgi:cytochrome c peroxidase